MTAFDDLLAAMANVPALPGAICKGRPALFDLDSPDSEDAEHAKALCRSCAALDACTRWLAATPTRQRPSGVVARQWLPVPSPQPLPPADDIRYQRGPQPRPAIDAATVGLADHLATVGGRAAIAATVAAAAAAGIPRRYLYEARDRLGLLTETDQVDRRPACGSLLSQQLQGELRPARQQACARSRMPRKPRPFRSRRRNTSRCMKGHTDGRSTPQGADESRRLRCRAHRPPHDRRRLRDRSPADRLLAEHEVRADE